MLTFLKETYYVSWSDIKFMRHNFFNILIMSIMSPLLYLLAFGYGLGDGLEVEGVPYIAFIIPGIAALSSLNSSFSSTSARLNVQRLYYGCFDNLIMCPVSIPAMVLGKSLMGVIRGLVSSSIIFGLGLFLAPDLMLTPMYIITIIVSCLTFSLLGVTAALLAKSHQSMATISTLLILPMTFLCGTFFTLSNMPSVVQAALYALPLTHSSEAIRAAALGWDYPWISLIVLLAFGVVFFAINTYLIRTRKV